MTRFTPIYITISVQTYSSSENPAAMRVNVRIVRIHVVTVTHALVL